MTGSEARGDSTVGTRNADLATTEPAGSLADAARGAGMGVPELPIEGYRKLTVAEILRRAQSFSPDELRQLREFEAKHRHRKTLLVRLDRMMNASADRGDSAGTAAPKGDAPGE
jgi:hypothetical protein